MLAEEGATENSLVDYLSTVVPQLEIEIGLDLCARGCVNDCTKSGSVISASVTGQSGEAHHVGLRLIAGSKLAPSCACPEAERRAHGWCEHAVALLAKANQLGFIKTDLGLSERSFAFFITPASGDDVAAVIGSTSSAESAPAQLVPQQQPEVTVLLDLSSDRLGVKVLFDGETQEHQDLISHQQHSARALDNLFINLLDEYGNWDEASQLWWINGSRGIALVFGLLEEFKIILSHSDQKPVTISSQPIDAELSINWLPFGAEIDMHWVLPDGSKTHKESDILGNDPYWVAIGNTVYPLTSSAGRIAALFPTSAILTLPRSQIGPVIEALEQRRFDPRWVKIRNPKEQPRSAIAQPTPNLELQLRQQGFEHFTSSRWIELSATLEFEYPPPPPDRNVVYLPNHQREREFIDYLTSLGFSYNREQRRYLLTENNVLDLLSSTQEIFPAEWHVTGFEQVRRKVRFSEIMLVVSLAAISDGIATPVENGSAKTSLRAGEIDWFDCQAHLTLNKARIPISTLFKGGTADADRWIRMDNGAFARVPGGSILKLKAILGTLDSNFRLANTIRCRLSVAQAMSLSRINDPFLQFGADKRIRELAERLESFEGIQKTKLSRSFKGKLRPYQADGLSWLNFLREFRFGGILADEMGLGKTIQALALFQSIKDQAAKARRKSKPILVVAPTSVVPNWWLEAGRFTPGLRSLVLQGPERKRFFSAIPEHDLVITSYALLRLDRYDLQRYQFDTIVLDEAQMIKNHQAATTVAAKGLKADNRLALSGTPTENRPLELWSIMDFLMPGYLGSYEFFRSYFEKPIMDGGMGADVAPLLRGRTRPFLLRRTKHEVEKDLPPKIETLLHVEMEDSQRDLYNQIIGELKPKVLEAIDDKGVAGASVSILAALMRLRQICNHPNSIESLKGVAGYESGKFNLLKDLLDEALAEGRKVLVFCQFLEMLNLIREHLGHAGVNYLYLDGATKERQPLIDQFNQDEKVRLFLISLKAGGLGLNLTAADTVVIYDPWWNPAVENQAVDRAHRIGQKKTVHVYRLVTLDSVEQRIMDLKAKKNALVSALVNETGLSTLSLTKLDVESLLAPVESITKSMATSDPDES